jgi:hypothetical protein
MKLVKLVHNVETGEVAEVELTKEELEQRKADIAAEEAQKEAAAARAIAREALLARLGITEDEAKLILG